MNETTLERAIRENGEKAAEPSPLSQLSKSDRIAEENNHKRRIDKAEERRRLARWAHDDLLSAVAIADKLVKTGEKFATADRNGSLQAADGVACSDYYTGINQALEGLVKAMCAVQFISSLRESEFKRVVSMTDQERYEAEFG